MWRLYANIDFEKNAYSYRSCVGSMGALRNCRIGMATTTLDRALIIHAIAAPIIVIAISSLYYCIFNYTTPLQTAIVFAAFIIFMDVFFVAMVINKSFDMFRSFIGTWMVFILIFVTTFISGVLWNKSKE